MFSAPSLTSPVPEQLATKRFVLQPHLYFFPSHYALLSYRYKLLNGLSINSLEKGDERWIALSLNRAGNVVLNEIDPQEKALLEGFNSRTLDEAIDYIAEKNPLLLQSIGHKIGGWAKRWMTLNWLAVSKD